MRKNLLQLAANIDAKGKHYKDNELQKLAGELADYASRLPEDSVSSSETTNDEEDDTGGGNHPGKPHNP